MTTTTTADTTTIIGDGTDAGREVPIHRTRPGESIDACAARLRVAEERLGMATEYRTADGRKYVYTSEDSLWRVSEFDGERTIPLGLTFATADAAFAAIAAAREERT